MVRRCRGALGNDAAAAAAAARRDEEVHEAADHPEHRHTSAGHKHQVHDGAALQVRHEAINGGHGGDGGDAGDLEATGGHGGRCPHRGDHEGIRRRDQCKGDSTASGDHIERCGDTQTRYALRSGSYN